MDPPQINFAPQDSVEMEDYPGDHYWDTEAGHLSVGGGESKPESYCEGCGRDNNLAEAPSFGTFGRSCRLSH